MKKRGKRVVPILIMTRIQYLLKSLAVHPTQYLLIAAPMGPFMSPKRFQHPVIMAKEVPSTFLGITLA